MNITIDLTQKRLVTERLTLRIIKSSDLDDFFEYASVDGVGQMCGWNPHKNIEESEMILEKLVSEKTNFALVLQGKMIGTLSFMAYKEDKLPEFSSLVGVEIGYCLSKEYWGMGLMPEALKEAVKFGFDVLKLDFIVCSHFLDNHQSQRVQEKCGFKHYKIVHHKSQNGDDKPVWISLLKKEEFYNV